MHAKHILGSAVALGAVIGTAWASVPLLMQTPEERARIEQSVTYSGCNEVRAAGKAPIYRGQPGFRDTMDGDGDGVACEPMRGGGSTAGLRLRTRF